MARKVWVCFGFLRGFGTHWNRARWHLGVLLKRRLGLFDVDSGDRMWACPVGEGAIDSGPL